MFNHSPWLVVITKTLIAREEYKQQVIGKLKPKSGYSHAFHIGFNALIPALIYVLVRIGMEPVAASLVLLAKWRMFAVRPRYWLANLRANAVDITIGLSIVIFMMQTNSVQIQLFWAVVYAAWLIFIKPGSSTFMTSIQAFTGQLFGLMAIFLAWPEAPLAGLIVLIWLVTYTSARHFFTSFEEAYTSLYAHTWGYFAAAMTWVLGHWLLFYQMVAQPTLLLTVLGFGLAALYYLEQTDRLSTLLRRQFLFIMIAIVVVVLVFSDWGDKAV